MLKTFCAWLLVFGYVFSIVSTSTLTFIITEPYNLYEWWTLNSGSHHYSVASFGEIPWGDQIMGRIGLADPIDGCSKIRVSNNVGSVPPILIVMRGQCTFATKARNAEGAGAKLLLIVDNVNEDVESKLMVDNSGNTVPIRIASVMIDKQSGDKLIEEVEQDERQSTVVSGVFGFDVSTIALPVPTTNTSSSADLYPGTLPTQPTPLERYPSTPSGSESERGSSLILVLTVVFCAIFALFVLFLYRRSIKKVEVNMQANQQNTQSNLQYVQYAVLGNSLSDKQLDLQSSPYLQENLPDRQPDLQDSPYLRNNLPEARDIGSA